MKNIKKCLSLLSDKIIIIIICNCIKYKKIFHIKIYVFDVSEKVPWIGVIEVLLQLFN